MPKLPPNASLDDSFVVLAPELALRARRGGGSRDLPSTSPGAASTARSLTVRGKGTTPMADSFVVLPNERRGGDELDANVMARVFDIASDLSDSDHPLCAECSAALVAEVERRTEEAEAECAAYEEALERLQSAEDDEYAARGDDATSEGIALAMQNVEKSQREADETLRALESELASTRLARNKLAKKAAALDEAEDTYWREFHAFKKNLNAHMEKRDAIVARTEQAQMHMERLEKTNVFNDRFTSGLMALLAPSTAFVSVVYQTSSWNGMRLTPRLVWRVCFCSRWRVYASSPSRSTLSSRWGVSRRCTTREAMCSSFSVRSRSYHPISTIKRFWVFSRACTNLASSCAREMCVKA